MKMDELEHDDEPRPEYKRADFGEMVRGKYAGRIKGGPKLEVNLVLLEPDVAMAFPSDQAVNEALRLVMRMAELPSKPQSAEASVSAKL